MNLTKRIPQQLRVCKSQAKVASEPPGLTGLIWPILCEVKHPPPTVEDVFSPVHHRVLQLEWNWAGQGALSGTEPMTLLSSPLTEPVTKLKNGGGDKQANS